MKPLPIIILPTTPPMQTQLIAEARKARTK